MRIVYLITRADAVGGASIHVRDMARWMLDRGHEAVVLVGGRGPVTAQLSSLGVPFRPLGHLRRAVNPLRDFAAFRELSRALAELKPDLVSAHSAKAGWIGRAAAHKLGLPVLYTPHGWTIGDRLSRAQGLLYRQAERMAARWSGAIVCVCEYERRLALEKRVARPEQLRVIYNGVHDVPQALRARPAASPVGFVSVARFEAPKDHDTLLRAFARLPVEGWTLSLVGGGPGEARARRLARELGIESKVSFAGYLPDPAEALARAQVFVLCSRSEAFPRSVLEAMRAGLPVAASGVGGVAEAVAHGRTGWLVPRGSVEALAGALARLIRDPGERERFGAAARQNYETRFRFERMAEKTMALYTETIEKSPRKK